MPPGVATGAGHPSFRHPTGTDTNTVVEKNSMASPGPNDSERRELVERTEAWFVARGTPRLVEGYDPSRDVLARILPILAIVFLIQTFRGIRRGWPMAPLWAALLMTAVITLVARVVVNFGSEGPLLRRVRSSGMLEETVFVLLPALVWFVATGRVRGALLVAVTNVVVLLLVYVVFSGSVVRSWARGLGRALRRTEAVIELALRTLPFLLVVFVFFFVNSELWQVGNEIVAAHYWSAILLLLLVTVAVIYWRVDQTLERGTVFESSAEVVSRCRETPVESVAAGLAEDALDAPELTRRQRIELETALTNGVFAQVLLISIPVFVFFVLFGLFVIPFDVIELWTQEPVTDPLLSFELFGSEVGVTPELLRVAGLLSAVAALYFAVNAASDETYREAFAERILVEIQRTLAVRAVYLTLLDRDERHGRSTEETPRAADR